MGEENGNIRPTLCGWGGWFDSLVPISRCLLSVCFDVVREVAVGVIGIDYGLYERQNPEIGANVCLVAAGASIEQSVAPLGDVALVVEAAAVGLELGGAGGLIGFTGGPDGFDQKMGRCSGGAVSEIVFVDNVEDRDAVVENFGFAGDRENGVFEVHAAVAADVEACQPRNV